MDTQTHGRSHGQTRTDGQTDRQTLEFSKSIGVRECRYDRTGGFSIANVKGEGSYLGRGLIKNNALWHYYYRQYTIIIYLSHSLEKVPGGLLII